VLNIFRTTNYPEINRSIDTLGQELGSEFEFFEQSIAETESDKELLESATQFCATTCSSAFVLADMSRKLHAKSLGLKYSMSEYKRDFEQFALLRNVLLSAGSHLQNL